MNFNVIQQADISQQDFADIVGVSRMTVHKAVRSDAIPRIERGLAMLQALVAANKLPRGYSRKDKASREALKEKLRTHFATLSQ